MITRFKLFESPDKVAMNDKTLMWRDNDAITFGYSTDYADADAYEKMYVGMHKKTKFRGHLRNENMFFNAKENAKGKSKVKDIEEEGFKIFVDLDGVLTDFDKTFYEQFLKEFNEENDVDIEDGWEYEELYGKKSFWHAVKSLGLKFWSDMSWTKDGKQLFNFIKDLNTEILSRPSADMSSRTGKKIWCEREMPGIKMNLSFNKSKFAKPDYILIDDLEENIESWKKAGGIGILHKNTKDTIKKLKHILNI